MRSSGLSGALPLIVAAAAVGVTGCSYTSDYKPPRDGRARAIWQDDKVVVAAPAELPDCASEEQPPDGYRYDMPKDGYGYYYAPSTNTHVSTTVIIVGRPPVLFIPGGGGGFSPGSISGGGSGNGAEYLVVALAVGAIIAFPFIAMGLALGHPEPEEEVAAGIDEVNAYNDQSRERLARCAAWFRREEAK